MKWTCLSGNCLCSGPGESQAVQPGDSVISISVKMHCAPRRAHEKSRLTSSAQKGCRGWVLGEYLLKE